MFAAGCPNTLIYANPFANFRKYCSIFKIRANARFLDLRKYASRRPYSFAQLFLITLENKEWGLFPSLIFNNIDNISVRFLISLKQSESPFCFHTEPPPFDGFANLVKNTIDLVLFKAARNFFFKIF